MQYFNVNNILLLLYIVRLAILYVESLKRIKYIVEYQENWSRQFIMNFIN